MRISSRVELALIRRVRPRKNSQTKNTPSPAKSLQVKPVMCWMLPANVVRFKDPHSAGWKVPLMPIG